MAFSYVTSGGFEAGANPFTASSGTLLGYPHYTELARQGMAPYRGAYAFRIQLAGGTTAQFIREDTAFDDLDNGVTRFFRWYFYLGKNFAMTDADKFSMVEFESTLNTTTEVAAGIQRTSGNIEFWYNETAAAASPSTIVLGTTTSALGKWFSAELKIVLSSGGSGTIDGYINDVAGAQIGSLTQSDIVDVKLGVIGPDAGTSGTILFDDYIYDDAQIYKDKARYEAQNRRVVFTNDHPIIGPAKFSIAVTAVSTGGVLRMYDTDGVPTNLDGTIGPPLRPVSALEIVPGHDVFECRHGLYTVLTGSDTEASVSINRGGTWSDGALVSRGLTLGSPRTK